MEYLANNPVLFDRLIRTSPGRQRAASLVWTAWFLAFTGLAALLALLMLRSTPNPSLIAWLIFLVGAVAIVLKPRYGVYLIAFFSLIGDKVLTLSYPFNANFSSMESWLYLHDSLIISPLEVYLGLTFLSWLGRGLLQHKLQFYRSELFWPMVVFGGFIVFGFVYGIGRGGDLTVGLWEARPIFYLAAMFVLVSNLLTEREHFQQLIWVAMVAIFIQGVIGMYVTFIVLKGDLSGTQGIIEHTTSIRLNSFLIFTLAVWLFKDRLKNRLLLPVMLVPVLITLFAAQRRAAYVTLIIAIVFFAFFLYRENRTAFWLIVPVAAMVFLLYMAAFWNNQGAVGLPAQAVKSQFLPGQINPKDQESDIYRVIENWDIYATIRANPLTGVGFGQMFYMVIPLPDISFFIWYRYITHNSILWIWMKAGVGGFLAMLFLIGLSITKGVQATIRVPPGILRATALTATLYIVMHFIFAYVDMSWFTQNMVYMGAMMGIIGSIEHIVAKPVSLPASRWPWEPLPQPAPVLLPFPKKDA